MVVDGIFVILAVGFILAAVFFIASADRPLRKEPEKYLDPLTTQWIAESRTRLDHTEICVVLVESKTRYIHERRVLQEIRNDSSQYDKTVDAAMESAQNTAFILNTRRGF